MAQFRIDSQQYLPQEKTLFEVVMLADQYGNQVGPANPSGMSVDAFGRARTSTPMTLYDSFNRYQDNGKTATANSAGGTFSFNANTSTIDCAVTTASGAYVYKETTRVFAYQPGKSLQILTTFVMNPPKANLRQRVGYFGTDNGFYLERYDASGIRFVKRSRATGAVVNTLVEKADWNIDKMDGTGRSGLTLNLDYPQIMFIDIEWLGVGTARLGFVVNGAFIHCHSFHHSNLSDAPSGAYMQTACLPLRHEIENTSTTTNSSILKIICSTVISEGGYELRGRMRTVGMDTPTSNNYTLTSLNTYYPVCSIRLKSDKLDAIVVPKHIALVGTTASDYRYKLISGANVTGGTWVSAGSDSAVEYNINATSMSGGSELQSSYLVSTGTQSLTAKLEDGSFKFQLERNSFTSTPTNFTLAVASKSNGDKVLAGMDWEEIT
jgi:hypothetical protein